MGRITIGALLNAPDAIRAELDRRNAEKAGELAQSLIGLFSRNGSREVVEQEAEAETDLAHNSAYTSSKNGWGSEGW